STRLTGWKTRYRATTACANCPITCVIPACPCRRPWPPTRKCFSESDVMQTMKWMHGVRLGVLVGLLGLGATWAAAQATGGAQIQGPGQVVAAGTVPDEATRVAVISRLREIYGAERVVDQLSLGSVVAPPQWSQHVQKLLSPALK